MVALVRRFKAPTHFVETFAKIRTGWGFIAGLALWISGWVVMTFLTGFDTTVAGERFGVLNFLLSVEATLSMPILYMGIEVAANRDRAKLDEVLKATQQLLATLSSVAEDVEDIEEKLDDVDD